MTQLVASKGYESGVAGVRTVTPFAFQEKLANRKSNKHNAMDAFKASLKRGNRLSLKS
jgi:hypothetical protein